VIHFGAVILRYIKFLKLYSYVKVAFIHIDYDYVMLRRMFYFKQAFY